EAAYAHCAAIARDHYENFPVASWLVPRRMRPHIAAIYAFARAADDFADEPGRLPDERLRLLAAWRAKLHRVARGEASDDPVFQALGHTIGACSLPLQLFDDLLSAFSQDVTVHRYETWDDLLDYCGRSANPVGRLVLRVARIDRPDADRASNALCSALQLANFWQDFGVDWRNGRLYVPREESARAGATEQDLVANRMTAEWKSALARSVVVTRALLEAGRPVADFAEGRLKYELRATWLGGMRILEKVERSGYDTLHHRPTLGPPDAAAIAAGALLW
ncbi:MAG TPA: squalene synthase HpnC, partial [Vicinamibacterales bacterium]|nr:squalene synthase HpnC [Vicinamibacterales bacterium]